MSPMGARSCAPTATASSITCAFAVEYNGFPEGGEQFLIVADEDGVRARDSDKAIAS
jgi:hypothetical protein